MENQLDPQKIGKLETGVAEKQATAQADTNESPENLQTPNARPQKQSPKTLLSMQQKRTQRRQKEGKFAGLMRNVNIKLYQREITTSTLETTIYDKSSLRSGEHLLHEQDLFLVDGGDEVEASPNLFHFIDGNVVAADLLLLLSVLGTCFFTPLTFIWGGGWGFESPRVPGGHFTFFCDLIMDLVYAGHLLLLLNTTFLHESRRVEVVDRVDIMTNHLRRPRYWIKWFGTTSYFWIALGAPCLINNIKAIRIWHFVKLPDSLWQLGEMAAFKMLRPIFLIYVFAHWLACVLACLGGYREVMERDGIASFRTEFDGNAISDWLSAYCMAFIEALYMLTGSLDNPLGDGGPREKNFGGLLIVAILGPVGCVGVAIFISSIIREQALASLLEVRHAETKAFLLRALETLDIPTELQRRVFSLHYFQKMSHDYEAFEQLFSEKNLSAALESALRVYLYQESVLSARYFKDKDPNYILEVVRILEDCTFLPGDYVARCGEVGTQMYFVARGTLCVLVPHKEARTKIDYAQEIKLLSKGDYFGDVALLKDCVRTAWVRAECYCILSMLTRSAIENIWKYFPEEREGLIESVKKRVNEDRRVNAQNLWRKANDTAKQANAADIPAVEGAGRAQPASGSTSDPSAKALGGPSDLSSAGPGAKPADEEEGASDLEETAEARKDGTQAAVSCNEPFACIERVEKACEALLKGQSMLQDKAVELQKHVLALTEVQTSLTDAVSWASTTFSAVDTRNDGDADLETSSGRSAAPEAGGKSKTIKPSARDGRKKKVAAKAKKKLSPKPADMTPCSEE